MTHTILLLDDEPNIRRILGDTLTRSGYAVTEAASVTEALSLLEHHSFDLALLDLAVAGGDGLVVARAIRGRYPYTGIIILTGQGTLQSAIEAIHLNAQGYLLKPVSPQELRQHVADQLATMADLRERDELAAHMRAAVSKLRTTPAVPPLTTHLLQSGSLQIDLSRRKVNFLNETVDLTTAEFDLLCTLVRSAGTVLDTQTLVQNALGYEASESESRELVKIHISHLRYKLEPNPNSPRYIVTVRGKGYMWAPD
jgi:DNA-binding response OmpR family regulator